MTHVTRRHFLTAAAVLATSPGLSRTAFAQDAQGMTLRATTRTLDINGRPASVYGLENAAGGQGLILDPGQRFTVDLTNDLDVETIIHWHGQIPPNAQDGVPGLPMPLLAPGERRPYDFAPLPGTHWMHSHVPVQEMQLLAAPLIVRSPADLAADRQEVVMLLHDFSFKPAEDVLAEITGGTGHDMAGMDHGTHAPAGAMDGMAGMDHGSMGGMAMDLNDYNFDAYLANDRTLNDPDVIRVESGGRVRLRIINAAAATVFWIDTGAVQGRLVAVDGHDVSPVTGTRFGIAMAQRLDIELDLPAGTGAFPILGLREGAREQTGIVLATLGAKVPRIDGLAETAAPAFDTGLAQELLLRAANPLAARAASKTHMMMLGGSMQPYLWTIDGNTWGEHVPVTATSGERVEIMFHNMSMMGHPMHLHGHAFQVVGIGNQRFAGAVRDTVYVPPMAMLTIAIDAGEAARWMLHCHHMPHLATGMMTEFAVRA
ncbi:MAG: multicopper oxidase domain-containing protein [Pseudotabrizicola sp.]|uniref:multicopper oxidase family protein n=1 Tax=Pseudotabrizicola sp. TaxID=2939647 RepID=UPI00271966F1|nr:multicopper oxidase domain-containing protein [Pseudotabrizicola sp.]MDO9641282.1 multicopper oxidase domain-containing protein [Pseudotabrizicola sp.]